MEKTELLEEIKSAMKARDTTRLSILRQINQALKQIEVDERREIAAADITRVAKKLIKITQEELDALMDATNGAHEQRISMLQQQMTTLQDILPVQLEGNELEAACKRVIEQLKATSMRDMGTVMSELTKLTEGNFDKAQAAQYIKQHFAQ